MRGRKRTNFERSDYRLATDGMRNFERYYGQKASEPISEYRRQMLKRMEAENRTTPSLPPVSILNTADEFTDDDFRAGKAALSAAGLT